MSIVTFSAPIFQSALAWYVGGGWPLFIESRCILAVDTTARKMRIYNSTDWTPEGLEAPFYKEINLMDTAYLVKCSKVLSNGCNHHGWMIEITGLF